jgi:hypothetical protein
MLWSMERITTPLQRAAALVAVQFGAISSDQLRRLGMTEQQVRTMHAKGLWRRPVRGVHVVAGAPDTAQQRAMVAFLSTRHGDGVLSHVTAAWVHELLPAPLLPAVTVGPHASARSPVAKIHRGPVPHQDRTHRWGMTFTTVSRTLVDLAPCLDRPTFEEVVDVAMCRKAAAVGSIEAALVRAGRRRGAETLRAAVAVWTPEIDPDSVAEARLLRTLGDLGVDDVITQYDVYDAEGRFIARLDVVSPSRRRGFEYDGVQFHGARRWEHDEARYARLRAAGWEVDQVTKLDLLPGEPRLRAIVERWNRSAAA